MIIVISEHLTAHEATKNVAIPAETQRVRYISLSLNAPSSLQGKTVPMRRITPNIAREDTHVLKTE